MTDEAQRIKIAEACPSVFERNGGRFNTGWDLRYRASGSPCDPLTDLNAMHEAEKVQGLSRSAEYAQHLYEVCRRDNKMDNEICATAAQRAEAFLRVLELWQD